jgi:SAM-dependent methyltransferase
MPHRDWNSSYAAGELPWDTGVPDENLIEMAKHISAGRALDIGCGTGTNAIWLAQNGFDVLGVDVAPLAIDKARAKAGATPRVRFEVRDFLVAPPAGGFDFVFDRGCFHVFDEQAERARFAAGVAALLAPGGRWLSLIGSTEGAPRDTGPPRRSARDVTAALEPALEIVELRGANFEGDLRAWICLSRRREMPAQPSTKHE